MLTGFGPFGKDSVNPALLVVQELDGQTFTTKKGKKEIEYTIYSKEVPVVFGKAIDECIAAVKDIEPDLILSIGQAGGRPTLSLERVLINLSDAPIPDNEGNKPKDAPIEKKGPAAYFATINLQKSLETIKKADIPAVISNTAGAYVCNNIAYGTLHFLATTPEFAHIKYGFIHIPYMPSQVTTKPTPLPSMTLEQIKKAILITINTNII